MENSFLELKVKCFFVLRRNLIFFFLGVLSGTDNVDEVIFSVKSGSYKFSVDGTPGVTKCASDVEV